MSQSTNGKSLKGRDLITVGIFSAIYFVINFIFMLMSGFHPLIWISTLSLREIIAALRSLRVPQKLIISILVTLRYFPAIKEEIGHIRDAMRLRNISGLGKVEATLIPMMISATNTAEELSAAAATRGIENPAKKTSLIQQALTELTAGKTVITIAHRLATIEHADQILVVDNGQIVQKGTHSELISQTGLYQRFISIRLYLLWICPLRDIK